MHYLLHGLRLSWHPKLRRYVLMPLILNIVVFSGLIWFGAHEFRRLAQWLMTILPGWLDWLYGLFWVLFWTAMLLLVVITFTLLANLISAPFNALLSLKTEQLLRPDVSPPTTNMWAEIPYALIMQTKLLWYFVWRAILCGGLFLIPGLQLLAPVAWFLLNAWVQGLQYLDYPAENHSLSFQQLKAWARHNRWGTYQFGGSVAGATMLPGLNLLIMPAAVIGATLKWCQEQSPPTLD